MALHRQIYEYTAEVRAKRTMNFFFFLAIRTCNTLDDLFEFFHTSTMLSKKHLNYLLVVVNRQLYHRNDYLFARQLSNHADAFPKCWNVTIQSLQLH